MLLKLRGGLNSFFVTALLGLLIAAFAIWGIGPGMLSGSNQSVATVGSTEVGTDRFFRAVQQRAQQLQVQFGSDISTPQLIQMMQLDRQILSQMIVDAAIREHVSSLGLRATDEQLAKQISEIEAFQSPDGSFSPQLMQQALFSSQTTERELFDDIRSGVARQQLLESFLIENMVPRSLADNLHVWRGERRNASLINITSADLTDIPAPTEEEIATYYEASKASYMTPERRSYEYLLLTPDYFASEVEVPEGTVEDLYERRSAEYAPSERRDILQVNFNNEEDAQTFVESVNAGADFVETAVATTEFVANELELGENNQAELETIFGTDAARIVFELAENTASIPVEDISGWNVFMVSEVINTEARPLEEVRAELEADYRNEQAIDILFDYQERIDTALEDTADLSEIATTVGLPLAVVTGVDASGVGTDGTRVVTQQNEYIVQSAAFREELEAEPELIDLNPTDATAGVYILKVTSIDEPAEQALEDVRFRVETDLIAQKRQARAGEIADAAAERLRNGESAELVADELGGTSFDANNVARSSDGNSSLSANIRNLIFDLDVGETDSEVSADGNGYVVVKVLSAEPGDPATSLATVDTLLDQLNAGFQEDLFVQYQAYLAQRYPAEINNILINQLFTSENLQ
ncbi:peptidylprolyl isomerase [Kordiimonas aquimaris]|uniref:peptidylprolyl isomerase n=1 Tax=Kordiimonas aquimaris TaxID=707591 RepID=UPI0021D0CEBE|nr:peptidylprolyl isomerase [Kordiimonas aquimaris]